MQTRLLSIPVLTNIVSRKFVMHPYILSFAFRLRKSIFVGKNSSYAFYTNLFFCREKSLGTR